MPNSIAPLATLQANAIANLTTYQRDADADDRTALLRKTAAAFVSAREHFFTAEGEPDWLGRTYAYRRWIRETMSLANVPGEQLSTIQAAIRYHSGNILRERLDDDTRAALGLRESSPRERSTEKRERHSSTLSIFGGGGQELTDAEEITAAGEMMVTALRRMSLPAVAALPKKDRDKIRAVMVSVFDLADMVAGAASTPKK